MESAPVQLGRGTSQGCPLSPLVFVVAQVLFAELIRTNPLIRGVTAGTQHHLISLYGENIVLFVTEPMSTLPHVLADIQIFFLKLQGIQQTYKKSIACRLNITNEGNVKECPFSWSVFGFKYLVVQVTPALDQLFKANYNPLLEECKKKLQTWSALPLSLITKINVSK